MCWPARPPTPALLVRATTERQVGDDTRVKCGDGKRAAPQGRDCSRLTQRKVFSLRQSVLLGVHERNHARVEFDFDPALRRVPVGFAVRVFDDPVQQTEALDQCTIELAVGIVVAVKYVY